MYEIQSSLNYLCFEMHDKADVVVGNVVNKPTDILFTNVAFIFITAPLGPKMNYWMLMNKMVVAGSKALRGKMVWNSTYVNLSNMLM